MHILWFIAKMQLYLENYSIGINVKRYFTFDRLWFSFSCACCSCCWCPACAICSDVIHSKMMISSYYSVGFMGIERKRKRGLQWVKGKYILRMSPVWNYRRSQIVQLKNCKTVFSLRMKMWNTDQWAALCCFKLQYVVIYTWALIKPAVVVYIDRLTINHFGHV